MKSHPILFFAAVDDERERCPHENLRPMPPTPAQREAERHRYAQRFCFWWGLAYLAGVTLLLAWLSMRGK